MLTKEDHEEHILDRDTAGYFFNVLWRLGLLSLEQTEDAVITIDEDWGWSLMSKIRG